MDEKSLKELLESVQKGKLSIEQALAQLRHMPFEDVGFAG